MNIANIILLPINSGGRVEDLIAFWIALNIFVFIATIICWIVGKIKGYTFMQSCWSDDVFLVSPLQIAIFINGIASLFWLAGLISNLL